MSEFQKVDKNEEKKQSTPEAGTVRRELSDVNGPQGGMLPDSVSQKIQSKRGSGTRLTPEQNKKYSGEFGRDMSDVRIHNDPESNAISQALNARAFTIGADVFLSKGIDPARSKRDQKTLTHELTHVVQQNGQAGSGPLRLGAAHTTQEHEAEASAEGRGGVATSASDTVQRGFWSDFGSSIGSGIGHLALKQFGLEDAFNDFMEGSDKVKNAEEKMKNDKDPDGSKNWEKYQKLISDYETTGKDVESAKDAYDKATKEYEKAKKDQMAATRRDPTAVAADINAAPVNDAKKRYEENCEAHEKLKKERLELLKNYDETITQEDVDKKDSGRFKMAVSVFFSAIAGGISTIADKGDPTAAGDETKNAAARAQKQKQARSKVNAWFASTNKHHIEKKKLEEKQTVTMKGITDEKQINIDEEYKDVLWAAYQDIKNEDALKDAKIDRQALWNKIKASGAPWAAVKGQIDDEIMLYLDDDKISADARSFKTAKAALQNDEKKMAEMEGFEESAKLKDEVDAAEANVTQAQAALDALAQKAAAESMDPGAPGVDVTIAPDTQHLTVASAQRAVDDARHRGVAAEITKAEKFKNKLAEMIREWDGLIAGKRVDVLNREKTDAEAARNEIKAKYENGAKHIYESADNTLKTAYDDAKSKRDEMTRTRAAASTDLKPEKIKEKLSKEQIDKLKGLIRSTVLAQAVDLNTERKNKESDDEAHRNANFETNRTAIAQSIRFNVKEEAKKLPFYQKADGGPLDDAALENYLLAGIKDAAEMKSFWDEVKSKSSVAAGTAFTFAESAPFIDKGTKAYKKILENMKKGGDEKYVRETEVRKVFNTIREKTYALLTKDLQTFFVSKDDDSFKNLFEGEGDMAQDKTRITNQVGSHIPIDADSEASALAEKIQAEQDKKHKAAPANANNEEEKKAEAAHNGLRSRETDKIIKAAFALVQKDKDLKDVYKNSLRFRAVMKEPDIAKLIEDGLNDSVSEKEIVEAVLTILKEKQAEKSKDAK